MSTAIIEVDDLQKTYREGWISRKRVDAWRGVSLTVPRGCVFGLLGPNGAGKTTLIKILLGLVRRSGGTGHILDKPLGHIAGRRRIGYLPEHHRFPRHLTGDAAMMYYGGLSGLSRGEILRRRPELLEMVGLSQWGTTPVRKYSKGMQQRLGIAQALLHQPDLLILDEPTDGVDPVGRADIRRLLKNLKEQGTTVFLNSHQLQEIELVCDEAAILSKGKVQRIGTIEEITRHPKAHVELVLGGVPESIDEALRNFAVEAREQLGSGPMRVLIEIEDQAVLNACIDGLRNRQIDIFEIKRMRTSLEDAFLNIVASELVE